MIRKLRVKFVLVNMAIVSIMLGVILGMVLYFTSADLEQESIRMMQDLATQPLQLRGPGEQQGEVRLPFFTLHLSPYGDVVSTGGGYYDLSDGAFLNTLIDQTMFSAKRLGVIEEYDLRYYRLDTPAGRCLVFADISSEQATLNGLVKTCVLIGAVSFLAFLVVSILLSKWAVRPVERAWTQQGQFVAAASHELKTPLTVIMTSAELLQDPAYDEEKRKTFLAGILTMSRQMKGLIEQMLELARSEGAQTKSVFGRVNLSAVVAQAALPFEAVFYERGQSLTSGIADEIQVCGDEASLRQVVEILLDNALKYASPGGAVRMTLERKGRSRCLLTVANQGEPIAPEDLENIFKRFYRCDPARSRNGSFGLGLSIAQSIVAQHRGRIWAESKNEENSFFVELPCA